MKNYTTLLRLTIRNRLAAIRSGSLKKADGKPDWGQIAALVCVALMLIMFLVAVIGLEYMMYSLLSIVRHPELLPGMTLMIGMVGMVLLSFFYVLSSLYFSRDSMWMAYLPVRSSTVLCAKLTEIWASEALINTVMLMPAFVMYGMYLKADALYYVRAIIIALASPILPIAIITLLSTFLARLVGGIRNSTLMTTLLSFAVLFGVVALEMIYMPTIVPDSDDPAASLVALATLLMSKDALLETITGIFPPIMWGIKALRGDLGMLALFVLVSLAAIAAVIALLGSRYLGLCMKQNEHAATRRKVKLTGDTWRVKSPMLALYQLEMRDIFRSSTNLTQCLSGTILFPLMLAVMLMGGSFSSELSEIRGALEAMLREIAPTDVALGLTALFGFVTFVSPSSPTAISREGSRHALLRTLPTSSAMRMNTKLLCGMTLSVVSLAVTTLVLVFAISLHPLAVVAAIVLALLMCYASNALSLTVDALHPVMNWTTEMQAIKQNVNVFYGMMVSILLLALPIAAVLLFFLNMAPIVRFACVAGIIVLEAALGYLALVRIGIRKYDALEG